MSNSGHQWIARVLLLLTLPPLIFAALHPDFSGSQIVPHGFLYQQGVPYVAVLWFEMHFGVIFHFAAAWLLTLLLPAARLLVFRTTVQRLFWIIALALAAPAVELFQMGTGRGLDLTDLLAHYLGMVAAGMTWMLVKLLQKSRNTPVQPA